MPDLLLAWWLLLGLTLAHALRRGGAPERAGAAILATGSIVAALAATVRFPTYVALEPILFADDVAVLCGFAIVALRANRFWPLCAAGLQMIAVTGHLARLVAPAMSPFTYSLMTGFWSWPTLAVLIAATERHRRRLRRCGVDRSWRTSSAR